VDNNNAIHIRAVPEEFCLHFRRDVSILKAELYLRQAIHGFPEGVIKPLFFRLAAVILDVDFDCTGNGFHRPVSKRQRGIGGQFRRHQVLDANG
jgi:hypothetical protein